MASYWGFPSIVLDGSLLNTNRHYEVWFHENRLASLPSTEEEGEIEDTVSVASEEAVETTESLTTPAAPLAAPVNIFKSVVQPTKLKQETAVTAADEEEEEGAVSSSGEDSDGMVTDSDVEFKRRTKAEAEVREIIMKKSARKTAIPDAVSVAKNVTAEIKQDAPSDAKVKKPEKRKADEIPQMKTEVKKPTKQLRCFSERDVDYRAMWKEQLDASKAPSNHPFFQISVRNVRTKAYCDLWESEEKKDYLYFKPGTWDHVKDVPRLTEDNLSKLSISEAKQFVSWLLAERKIGNSELLSLRRRFWAENDRLRRLKAYVSGQRKLPNSASAAKLSNAANNNPTLITPEGLLVVSPKEQKRLLQGISKLWMTEETSNLLKQKQRVYSKMKKRGTDFFKTKFKELDRLCRAEVKKAKQHWETYMMDCIRQNGIIVGSILEEIVERVAVGHVPPDPRALLAQQRRFWQSQRGGGPAWARRGGFRGKPQRGKSRADELQL